MTSYTLKFGEEMLTCMHSKYFLKKCGHDGLNRMLAGFEDHGAKASCVIAFIPEVGAEPITFVGTTEGRIVPARNKEPEPFGWDPIFEPLAQYQPDPNTPLTYGEMDKTWKNTISHRYKCLEKFREYILNNCEFQLE